MSFMSCNRSGLKTKCQFVDLTPNVHITENDTLMESVTFLEYYQLSPDYLSVVVADITVAS